MEQKTFYNESLANGLVSRYVKNVRERTSRKLRPSKDNLETLFKQVRLGVAPKKRKAHHAKIISVQSRHEYIIDLIDIIDWGDRNGKLNSTLYLSVRDSDDGFLDIRLLSLSFKAKRVKRIDTYCDKGIESVRFKISTEHVLSRFIQREQFTDIDYIISYIYIQLMSYYSESIQDAPIGKASAPLENGGMILGEVTLNDDNSKTFICKTYIDKSKVAPHNKKHELECHCDECRSEEERGCGGGKSA